MDRRAVSLISIRGRSQNVERGLCPSSGSASRRKDKAGVIHHYIDREGLDFVCIQESGVRSDDAPPPLASVFQPSGHHLVLSGAHSARNGFDTVAIAVHKRWKVRRRFQMAGSSRCLGLELVQGSCRVFVASVLLPPGLDFIPLSAGCWEHRQTRDEARRVLAEVQRWAAPYPVAFICGDFNCTVERGLDRGDDGKGPRTGNVLVESILGADSGFADLFRVMHPGEKGWTRGDARLDYALLKAPEAAERVACFVDGGFPSDHEGVCFQIRTEDVAPEVSEPWRRKTFRVCTERLFLGALSS